MVNTSMPSFIEDSQGPMYASSLSVETGCFDRNVKKIWPHREISEKMERSNEYNSLFKLL